MIRARRLFLAPAISCLFFLVPVAGIPLFLLAVGIWYLRNQDEIHAYFVGKTYKQNEYSDKTAEELI